MYMFHVAILPFQDFSERMLAHRDNKHYVQWSLEETASLMCRKFPSSNVFVIKPCEMSLGTFSIYSNFVTFDELGVPRHKDSDGAWAHLKELTQNAFKTALDNKLISEDSGETTQPVDIIGFSKGCVVLNQLLYELNSKLEAGSDTRAFIDRVGRMTWLDGGHAGHGEPTWVCDANALSALKQTNIMLEIHVTPYQVKDPMRPWKGKEYRKFINALRRLGLKFENKMHFKEEEGCIENHFKVLQDFAPDQLLNIPDKSP